MINLNLKNRVEKSGISDLLEESVNRLILVFTLVLFVLSVFDLGFSPVREIETLYRYNIFRFIFPATGILFITRSLLFTDRSKSGRFF